MSSASVGSGSVNRSSSRNRLRTRCFCGDTVGRWTSSTLRNPGRRFIGCPNYEDKKKSCKYYAFIDPPLPSQWYKDMLFKYINNYTEFEEEEFCGDYAPRAEFEEEDPHDHQAVVQEAKVKTVVKPVMEGGDGGFVVSWKIGFFLSLCAIVWLLVM